LDNRDDAKESQESLFGTLFSEDAVKIKFFFTGDDDIINGIILGSQHQNWDTYYVMYITD